MRANARAGTVVNSRCGAHIGGADRAYDPDGLLPRVEAISMPHLLVATVNDAFWPAADDRSLSADDTYPPFANDWGVVVHKWTACHQPPEKSSTANFL